MRRRIETDPELSMGVIILKCGDRSVYTFCILYIDTGRGSGRELLFALRRFRGNLSSLFVLNVGHRVRSEGYQKKIVKPRRS
jgi:hypothetical protein